jgi:hypothetical protein
MRRHPLCLPLLIAGLFAAAGVARSATWPGPAPCNGTLQACIDAQPPAGEVLIDTDGPIDEAVDIGKPFALAGASGRMPAFAPGRRVRAQFAGGDSGIVVLRRLKFQDARVELAHAGHGNVDFDVAELEFSSSGPAIRAGILVDLPAVVPATRRVRLARNRLRVATPGFLEAAIALRLGGQAVEAIIEWNLLEAVGGGGGIGIGVEVEGGANAQVRVHGNEVRGEFGRDAILVAEGRALIAPSTVDVQIANNVAIGPRTLFGGGIGLRVYDGTMEAQVINNTVVQSEYGILLQPWSGGGRLGTGTISGRLFNNLLAFNFDGILRHAPVIGSLNHDYNLRFGMRNSIGTLPLGPNEVTANPRLRAVEAPRLSATSPARDAGNPFALLFVPNPDHDADGLRRFAGPTVDIGAYEFGHRSVSVRKTSAAAEAFTAVADPQIDADRAARLFPTANFHAGGTDNLHPLGVFDLFDQWWVRNSNGAVMGQGAAFNLFSATGSSSNGVRQHVASGANTLDGATLIDWSLSNDRPDQILLFAQATAFGAPANPHPVALHYDSGRWQLVTTNGSPFTTNTTWNLYAQRPSPNAFRHIVATTAATSVIDHPLLNGQPCARAHVSPIAHGGSNGIVFDLEYVTGSRRWRLFSGSGSFPAGARFNVVVVPEQVEQCSIGRLFRDGFEP